MTHLRIQRGINVRRYQTWENVEIPDEVADRPDAEDFTQDEIDKLLEPYPDEDVSGVECGDLADDEPDLFFMLDWVEPARCPDCAAHPGWATADVLQRHDLADTCRSCLGSGVLSA